MSQQQPTITEMTARVRIYRKELEHGDVTGICSLFKADLFIDFRKRRHRMTAHSREGRSTAGDKTIERIGPQVLVEMVASSPVRTGLGADANAARTTRIAIRKRV